ncbi:uncharacterized protein LOC116843589 [Odontomachus brunneus]|uniref:uncharacterized protein LOC116843589 n=1 Tax=Odontomachus brunneus TaxID=486640 RepID=UPI0013F2A1DD|nr:uncharacterized protein LOC116843589 [Odontomachus brunneus]XP_032669986.1 uncharacterized protein LOC116843589 [Odontomachus brunneus]
MADVRSPLLKKQRLGKQRFSSNNWQTVRIQETTTEELTKKTTSTIMSLVINHDNGADPTGWSDFLRKAQSEDSLTLQLHRDNPQNFPMRDGLVRVNLPIERKDKIIVPNHVAWEFVRKIHEYLAHFGTEKMLAFANDIFAIHRVTSLVQDVVASCRICIASKIYTKAIAEPHDDQVFDTGEMISIDLYGSLPRSHRGNVYVIILIDHFSKHTKLYPTTNQNLESITEIIEFDYIRKRQLVPKVVLTNNRVQFITKYWKQFAERLGFRTRCMSLYNPKFNPVEHVLCELERVLRAYSRIDHQDWDRILPRLEAVINATVHSTTGFAPNQLERGYTEILPNTSFVELPAELRPLQEERDNVELSSFNEKEAKRLIRVQEARAIMQATADKKLAQAIENGLYDVYEPGDLVWIRTYNKGESEHPKAYKLLSIYHGPYLVEKNVHTNVYVLSGPDGKLIGINSSSQMRPHREPLLQTRFKLNLNDQAKSNETVKETSLSSSNNINLPLTSDTLSRRRESRTDVDSSSNSWPMISSTNLSDPLYMSAYRDLSTDEDTDDDDSTMTGASRTNLNAPYEIEEFLTSNTYKESAIQTDEVTSS